MDSPFLQPNIRRFESQINSPVFSFDARRRRLPEAPSNVSMPAPRSCDSCSKKETHSKKEFTALPSKVVRNSIPFFTWQHSGSFEVTEYGLILSCKTTKKKNLFYKPGSNLRLDFILFSMRFVFFKCVSFFPAVTLRWKISTGLATHQLSKKWKHPAAFGRISVREGERFRMKNEPMLAWHAPSDKTKIRGMYNATHSRLLKTKKRNNGEWHERGRNMHNAFSLPSMSHLIDQ